MLEYSSNCLNPGYYHIVHSHEGFTTLTPQLNYITDIVSKLKAKLAKIKAEVNKIKKQLAVDRLQVHRCCSVDQGCPRETKFLDY